MLITSSDAEPVATVFGVPFDSTHSYKPGCRFGPDAIRDAFNNIEVFHPSLGIDLEEIGIRDIGNTRHTVMSSTMIEMVQNITIEILDTKKQIIVLGGEHSITYGIYTQFPKETGYVVFDAHYDLRNEFADNSLSHASYLRRIVEERGSDKILHVGARAFVGEELEFLKENNIATITDKSIRDGNGSKLLSQFIDSFESVYVSFDLDVLDPAFAPGVGNPEAVGISPRELFEMIDSFAAAKVLGLDIVELNPYHDNGATSTLAAKIMSTMIASNLAQEYI